MRSNLSHLMAPFKLLPDPRKIPAAASSLAAGPHKVNDPVRKALETSLIKRRGATK